jgi:hypothetical protein
MQRDCHPNTHVQPTLKLSVASKLDEHDLIKEQAHQIEGLGGRASAGTFFNIGHCEKQTVSRTPSFVWSANAVLVCVGLKV